MSKIMSRLEFADKVSDCLLTHSHMAAKAPEFDQLLDHDEALRQRIEELERRLKDAVERPR